MDRKRCRLRGRTPKVGAVLTSLLSFRKVTSGEAVSLEHVMTVPS